MSEDQPVTFNSEVRRFLDRIGPEVLGRLATGELVITKPLPIWRIWRTVTLNSDAKEVERVLMRSGPRLDELALEMVRHQRFWSSVEILEIDLVVVSPAMLGFREPELLRSIYEKARSWGLELCPPAVGPALFLEYQEQPDGEELFIAMEGLEIRGCPRVFSLTCPFGRRRLGSDVAMNCFLCPEKRRLVFQRSRLYR